MADDFHFFFSFSAGTSDTTVSPTPEPSPHTEQLAQAVPPPLDRLQTGQIIVLGPNPALQKTMIFEDLAPGRVNRAVQAYYACGGKGQNVARALHRLAPNCALLLQFLGGSTGQQLSEILAPHHIPTHTVKIAQPTRMATTLLSRLATAAYPETELIDPSPHVSHEEAMALIMALREATGTSLTRHSHSRLGLALMGTSPQCEDRLDLYVTALQAVARVVESAAAALAASSALLPVDGQFYRSGDGAAKGDAETAEPALTDSATPANQQEHQQADLLPLPLILLDASKDVDHVLATGRISVLKINYHELQTIAKLPPDDCPPRLSAWAAKQSRTALQQLLLHLHVPALAVTDGGHPAFLCHFVNDDAPPAAASADAVRETSELIVAWTITLPPVQVFNAVGCGDITSAAMLAALLADPAKLPWETRDTSSGTLSGEMVLRAFQFGLSVATAACQVKPDAWRLDRALEIMRQLQVTSLFST